MITWYDFFEPKINSWEKNKDIPKLIVATSDTDLEVRCLAYDALGRVGTKENINRLCKAVLEEKNASARARGAIALGRLGDDIESKAVLFHLLRDESSEVRAAATRGLSRQVNQELFSVFCALLEDEDINVVVEAIYALGQFGNHRAVTPIHRIFDRCDRAMKELASSAINSINLNQPMGWPSDEVYFFTYSRRGYLICECYSYKLVAWRNYWRRRWRYPFARDWGIGCWEISSLENEIRGKVLRPGLKLKIYDQRA
ncbi:MAG: HEAT repeat domain-containing protein [Blastocatellia bacterium]|nr:HEAT repeat domain-containing protein [Blastocatellia bacterium]MBN8723088.1 HEAT repeat domain-containing protein [Acidobacteriota bacterium]